MKRLDKLGEALMSENKSPVVIFMWIDSIESFIKDGSCKTFLNHDKLDSVCMII